MTRAPMLDAFSAALRLLGGLDREVTSIAWLSVWVSVTAVAVALVAGLPLGALVALARFPGRRAVVVLLNAGMGLPSVVVGIVVYLLLSRSGPLGALGWIFHPPAMVLAQALLATPLVAALARQFTEDADGEAGEPLRALGLGLAARMRWLLWHARFSLVVAALAGLGRTISEVGAVMLVGGNVAGHTRTMTTAIALETSKGDLPLALALGLLLLGLVIGLNLMAAGLRGRAVRRHG